VTAPRSRTVKLATGLDYHVLEWGSDDPGLDHTVVLLHGFLDLAWGWLPTVEAGLAGRFHLVAPDFRGHGDSDRIGAGGYYHFVDYLADLDDLIAQLGRSRVSLVGHSMGGSVAAYFTGSFPDRVARLALLEGMGPPENHEQLPDRVRTWLTSWRRVRERGQKSYASLDEATAQLAARDPLMPAELARFLADKGTRKGEDGRLRFKHDPLHATTGPTPFRVDGAAQFWRAITCPVLLVDGAESEFQHMGAEAERRAGFLADSRRVTLAGAGHMMQRHQPTRLAVELVGFLAA
jgi:pimeloyl-ACP methyl ester carboxylesterase